MKIPFTAAPEVPTPTYATEGSSGMDFYALEDATVLAGGRLLFRTGISIAMPPGVELQIRSRSGLSAKKGLIVLNAPATIDSDYRGEITILLYNSGHNPVEVLKGDRIAQGVFAFTLKMEMVRVDDLDTTPRGMGGLGSTGR